MALVSDLLRFCFVPGQLLGYQIHVKDCNGSAFHSNITLNATTTHFVLANLTLGQEYTVRAVAFTKLGPGPFSSPEAFLMDPALITHHQRSQGDVAQGTGLAEGTLTDEPWFVALLGSVVVIFILVIFVGIITYRFVFLSPWNFHRPFMVLTIANGVKYFFFHNRTILCQMA